MLESIIKLIIILFCIWAIVNTIKDIKRTESVYEKIIWVLFLFVYLVPATVYILDSYDIPTKFYFFNRVNINRWNDFLISYVNMIVGNVFSGVILLLITLWQVRKQIENNNDDKRIQNAPIFDYILTNNVVSSYNYNHTVELKEHGNNYIVFFKIENIGLNHSKNIKILIKVDNEEDRKFSINRYQSFIKKGEFVWIKLIFNLDAKTNENRKITMEVYYDDLIKNNYVQRINAEFKIKENSSNLVIGDFNVEDESLIKKERRSN